MRKSIKRIIIVGGGSAGWMSGAFLSNQHPNLEIALRVYGHQSPITATFQDCEDTKLEVAFAPQNHTRIKQVIRQIEPKGTTPIARSLEAAAGDFPDRNARNII